MTGWATMVNHRPESPAGNELHYNLDQLREFNSTTPFQQQAYGPDASLAFQLGHPASAFASPGLGHETLPVYPTIPDNTQYGSPFAESIGLGIQYDGYPSPPPGYFPAAVQDFDGNPYYSSTGLHNTAPPTPRSTPGDAVRRTRSGRSGTRSESPSVLRGDANKSRVTKSRSAKANKTSLKTPRITAPLSELTKDMTDIPVRDMEAWVNRSMEERQREVEKRNGYVTRPMNSFMLYRSAYAERTKQWCLQNNHQIVSSVSGESWPKETPEIRNKYNELAKTERANHALAHPTYKFSPSKVPGANRKKKEVDSDEDDDAFSESDDPDTEWKPRNERRARSKAAREQAKRAATPSESPLLSQFGDDSYFGANTGFNAGWEMPNVGRPLPVAFGSPAFNNQYYPPGLHPDMPGSGIDDMQMHSFGLPGDFSLGDVHSGIPQGFSQMQSETHTPVQFEHQVDPMLLQHGDHNGYSLFEPTIDDAQFGDDAHLYSGAFTSAQPASQFEEWMEQRNS